MQGRLLRVAENFPRGALRCTIAHRAVLSQVTPRPLDRITVRAEFDSEAQVWYVAETSLPGLNAEAETVEGLVEILPGMIQDLLEEDGSLGARDDPVSLEVIAHTTTLVPRAAA